MQSLALVNSFNIYIVNLWYTSEVHQHTLRKRLQGKGKINRSGDSFKLANWWQGLARVDGTLHRNMVFAGTWQRAGTHTVPSFSFLLSWRAPAPARCSWSCHVWPQHGEEIRLPGTQSPEMDPTSRTPSCSFVISHARDVTGFVVSNLFLTN